MENKKEFSLQNGGWVISDGDFLHWDIDDKLNVIPFPSIASAVRQIQAKDLSAKTSLNTSKINEDIRTYQGKNCDGKTNFYWIYRICEHNIDFLIEIDKEME